MSASQLTYDLSLLNRSVAKWQASPALRAVYADIFAEMRLNLIKGSVLEVGSGIGAARDHFPEIVLSDIIATRFVDRVVSAYEIPREKWANILATDMLHHLQEPLRFMESAAAALSPGGRIILAEPAGTPWGQLFYRLFHHEPCRPEGIPRDFKCEADADGRFANMGMASALFDRERDAVTHKLQGYGLRIVSVRYRDLFAYPATGGFSGSALLPAIILRRLLALEKNLPQAVLRVFALRMVVVLQKDSST